MSRILVHVEGYTEEAFVNQVLAPHLYRRGYAAVNARLVGNARQRSRRGGGRSWAAVRKGILDHLQSDQAALSTTMVDYYGLPRTWPGREGVPPPRHPGRARRHGGAGRPGGHFDRNRPPAAFRALRGNARVRGTSVQRPRPIRAEPRRPRPGTRASAIRRQFQTPEGINDSPDTAPSKRVLNLYGGYRKPVDGVQAIEEIGLDTVRAACPLFDAWVSTLEQQARR